MFKALHVSLPLLELLDKMPKYAKFLRDIMSRYKQISKGEKIIAKVEYSVMIARKIPPKLKNLYLSFIRIGELRDTSVTIQLVGRSLVHPKGVLEDVLVKLRQFILLIVFIILDFKEDFEIPTLLERPFLDTFKANIDVEKGELTMKINVKVKVFKCVYACLNRIDLSTSLVYACRSTCSLFSRATNQLDQSCWKWCKVSGTPSRPKGVKIRKRSVLL